MNQTTAMYQRWLSYRFFARAAILTAAITLGFGCTTQTIDETMSPYASRSDEGADPSSVPHPMVVPELPENPTPPPESGVSGTQHAIGDAVLSPFRALGKLFE